MLLAALGLILLGWLGWGMTVVGDRAARSPPPPGELRGAWHVHTTRSDGRGTLEEVLGAARAAGLQFVVVTDHNVLAPEDAGWHDGVLVIEASEASSRFGHVVAAGVPRALTAEECGREPLEVIAALGGQAVLAHPFHARRPWSGWERGPWRGIEVVSNDTSWGEITVGRGWGRVPPGLVTLPFDAARTVIGLVPSTSREEAVLEGGLLAAPPGSRRQDGQLAPSRVLLCSADAHGYPSYRAAFEAFSMHVPVRPTGEAAADGASVLAALLDGRASCVFDGVAPAANVRLTGAGGAVRLSIDGSLDGAEALLWRGGAVVASGRGAGGGLHFDCLGGCGPGTYRAVVTRAGRPWIFTNPVVIE
jgi:predicted metal-dependent phosphoesterase TrpH